MSKLLDINNTLDLIKLRFYNEWLYNVSNYDDDDGQMHKVLTEQVVKTYVDPLNLETDANILDIGSGAGYFLDEMTSRGFTSVTGITLSHQQAESCRERGHTVQIHDMSFLHQTAGWIDESVDFIFLRHTLEHSPYPIFTLMEYNRVLKQGARIYIEVPAPDCDRKHEYNNGVYSIFGASQLAALLMKTGFDVEIFNNFEFDIQTSESEDSESTKEYKEKYYSIIAKKARPLDIK